MNLILKFIRLKFKTLSAVSPSSAARQAMDLFQRPHFQKLREREKEFLDRCEIIRMPFSGEDIIFYQYGDKVGQNVLMIHGWDSNPGSMGGIATKLGDMGFNVLLYNVPAHGISVQKTTNMLYVSEILAEVLKRLSKDGEISVVTHSFGSGAISFALKKTGIKVDKIVFVTSPDKLYDIFYDYALRIGLSLKALKIMCHMTEKRFNRSFDDMHVSKQLRDSKFNGLLLVHDKNDTVLPFKNVEKIASLNQNSLLFPTEGKGHYRILWDDKVIFGISDFLSGQIPVQV